MNGNPLLVWVLIALASTSLACATFAPNPAPEVRPADFAVQYDWWEGSLPPPYHYEYSVAIAADGVGTVTYLPDYPSEETPTWVETFTLDAAQLDELYARLRAADMFTTVWREADDIPVGGSSSVLTVTANGATTTVPAFPDRVVEQADAAKSAVYAIVPAEIWERLTAQRDQYVQENEAP